MHVTHVGRRRPRSELHDRVSSTVLSRSVTERISQLLWKSVGSRAPNGAFDGLGTSMRAAAHVSPTPNASLKRPPDAMNRKPAACRGSEAASLRLVPAQDVEQVVPRVAPLFYLESLAPPSHVLGGVLLREDAVKVA